MDDKRLVVFDLDGTLFNTLTDLTNAVNFAMRKFNLVEYSCEEVRHMIGNGAEILISRALPQDKQALKDVAYDCYTQYYDAHLLDNTVAYQGIPQLICELRQKSIEVGVFSNKADSQVKLLCKKLLGNNVNYAIGRQKGGVRKPDPFGLLEIMNRSGADLRHTVFVGDSTVDIDTAKNGNVPCISVDWGYNDRDVLEQHGAKNIVSTPKQLLEQILTILI